MVEPVGPTGPNSGSLSEHTMTNIEQISTRAVPDLVEEEWNHEVEIFDPKTQTPKWVVDAEKFGSDGFTLRMPEDKEQKPAAKSAIPINRMAQLIFSYIITPLG